MKMRFVRVSNWLLSATIVGLGFSACGKEAAENGLDMYGTPTADYVVSGKVTDAKGNPVQGIEVTAAINSEYDHAPATKATTDSKGDYKIERSGIPMQSPSVNVSLKDVDGDLNGAFEDKTKVIVQMDNYTGGKGWFRGTAKATYDTKLTPKQK